MSPTVPSPCINVCKMNDGTGLCEGCWRSIEEIATWAALPDGDKRIVLARVAERRRYHSALMSEPFPDPARPARDDAGGQR